MQTITNMQASDVVKQVQSYVWMILVQVREKAENLNHSPATCWIQ